MNKGIDLASGDIIGILNSDDYYYRNTLQIVNNYFNQNKNIDFLFGSVIKHKLLTGFFPKSWLQLIFTLDNSDTRVLISYIM